MKNHSFQWLLLCFLILFRDYLLCYLINLSNPAKLLCNLTPPQKELTCLDLPASLLLLPSSQSKLLLPLLLQDCFYPLTPPLPSSLHGITFHSWTYIQLCGLLDVCLISHCPACPLMFAEEGYIFFSISSHVPINYSLQRDCLLTITLFTVEYS